MNCIATGWAHKVKLRFVPLTIGILLIVCVFLNSPLLLAQEKQVNRYERPFKMNDHEFILQSMGKDGLALFRDTEKFEKGKKKWEVTFVNTDLTEEWQTTVDVDSRKNIAGHEYYEGNIYLVFIETEFSNEITLIKINAVARSFMIHTFKPETNIHFAHFTLVKSKAVFGGYIQNEAVLFMYDLNHEVAHIIPGTFQPKIELLDIRTNANGTFNVLLKERAVADKKMVVRTYDDEGVLLFKKEFAIEGNKTILEAMTNTLEHDELVIVGTWTYGNNKTTAGIFSAVVDPTKELPITYYWLTDLEHFLDYLKPKRAAKIKAKAEWRKRAGKNADYRVSLSSVRIQETESGFFFLTEAYDAPASYYNTRYYSPYGYYPYASPYSYGTYYPYAFNSMPSRYYYPYGSTYPYNSGIVNQVRIFQTSLAFLDLTGKLQYDRSLKFKEIKMTTKEQASDFTVHQGIVTLACKNEKDIFLSSAKKDGTEPAEELLSTVSKSETCKSESQENSGIRAWYDGFFYVFGYHTVKNNIENTSRDVFYINKVKGG